MPDGADHFMIIVEYDTNYMTTCPVRAAEQLLLLLLVHIFSVLSLQL